jgi:hypothetical protein
MLRWWTYEVKGTTGDGVSWQHSGSLEAKQQEIYERVMVASFHALTTGKAVYGRPGLGCKGPYDITFLKLEAVDEHRR